jgi:phosphoglycolate phosphatase
VEAFNYFAGDGIANALRRAMRSAGVLNDDQLERYMEEGLPLCRRWMDEDPLYLVEPYEHMVESLHVLKDAGIIITVFSNKPHSSAVNVVETIFGKGMFDYIQGQTDRIPIKPDPTGVFEILDKFGCNKDECLYFGDTNTDMLTARNAGVTAVGVSWGFRPREELEEYGADIIIDSPAEIPALAGLTDR